MQVRLSVFEREQKKLPHFFEDGEGRDEREENGEDEGERGMSDGDEERVAEAHGR